MNKFKFYLDRKVTVWERDTFEIEAETKEEAIATVITAAKEDLYNGQLEFEGETGVLYDTQDFIEAKGEQAATVEIYDNETHTIIWKNWEDM
jgi:hypothetical protein